MDNECQERCEKCKTKDLCPLFYGQSLGLTIEQVAKFRNLVLQYHKAIQESLIKEIFGSDAVLQKESQEESFDMEFLEKYFRQPEVFPLVQAAEIFHEQNEQFDLVEAYYNAFLLAMKPANRAKYNMSLNQRHNKALAVRALILAKGHQLEMVVVRNQCPFEKDKQCQACWLGQVCKIQLSQ